MVTYKNVELTSSTGTGATCNITVNNGVVDELLKSLMVVLDIKQVKD